MRDPFRTIALLSLLALPVPPAGAGTIQVTANATEDEWSAMRQSVTSSGKILFRAADGVRFFDGTSESLIQADGALGQVSTTMGLGTGPTAGSVVGFWRRGTKDLWVWSEGGAPVHVSDTNPFFAARELNPENGQAGGGCVFIIYQTQNDDAQNFRHVFKPSVADGSKVLLTETGTKTYVETITADGCRAAWDFDPDFDTAGDAEIQYYDGVTITTLDTGDVRSPHLSGQWLVWVKAVGAVDQVIAARVSGGSSTPVQLTSFTDPSSPISAVVTDGRRVALLRSDVTGTELRLAGATLPAEVRATPLQHLQAHSGQFAFGEGKVFRYTEGGRIRQLPLGPAIDSTGGAPRLADRWLAHSGLSNDGGTDREVFRTGVGTSPSAPPAAPLLPVASRSGTEITLDWDTVLGASSYNVYYAPGDVVSRAGYAALAGGTKVSAASRPFVLSGVQPGESWAFAVSAVIDGVEAVESGVAIFTWSAGTGMPAGASVRALAATPDGLTVYAATSSSVLKSVDGGLTWTALAGGIDGLPVRGLACRGEVVLAITTGGEIWRSSNGGGLWTRVADGTGLGESNASITFDPLDSNKAYAGNLTLPGYDFEQHAYVVRSIDGGATWEHTAASPDGEVRAYALAIAPGSPSSAIYAGGSGVPVSKSVDGGQTWTDVSPPGFLQVYALAVDPEAPATVFAGGGYFDVGVGGQVGAIHRSDDGGSTWTLVVSGLPGPVPMVRALAIGPAGIFAATDAGLFWSEDAGGSWAPYNVGFATPSGPFLLALTADARGTVQAGTDGEGAYTTRFPGADLATRVEFHGDFDADGDDDILLRHAPTGEVGVRLMNGVSIDGGGTAGVAGSYSVAGLGDFDGDGRSDVLLRDQLGNIGIWRMSGSSIVGGGFVGSPGSYSVAAVADFDGDGKHDILLRDALGNLGIWKMNGSAITAGGFVGSPGAYTVAAARDFDGDGKADILLRDSLGNLGLWFMDGFNITSGGFVGSPGNYRVAGASDFSGDGKADILLRDHLGNLGLWVMDGTAILRGGFVGSPGAYGVASVGDYDGDGMADILLRDRNGSVGIWFMDEWTITGGGLVAAFGDAYEVH